VTTAIPDLGLTALEVLTTTRAVRHRLALDRPVDPAVLRRCVEIALQAPTGRNSQRAAFVVVTEPERKHALADLWRRGLGQGDEPMSPADLRRAYAEPGSMERVWSGLRHLADNLHRVPALVIPCIEGRAEHLALPQQASHFGSILPAVWSFLLAARAHGLGTVWTTGNLAVEREVAELLGIPYDEVMQVALIPVAHTKGTAFRPAHRVPVDEVLHWNRW
jgi:Nitroreductase